MRALQLVTPSAPLELREVPDPTPQDGEVVVAVAGCGVCHTDLGYWRGGVATRRSLPLTLGHEIAGVVVAAAAGHEALLGSEVIVPAVIPCGACALCRAGRSNVCRAQRMPGNDMDGGFADYVAVPAHGLCPVNERGGLTLAELAVVADAVTTPFQAVLRSGLRPGEVAIVVGAGGVGAHCVQVANAFGAHVVAIDIDEARLAFLQPYGAQLTLDARVGLREIRARVREAARAWGAAEEGWKIFECSGHRGGQELAWGLLTHAATLLVIGFTLDKVELRLSNLMAFDATAQGTWGCKPELYPQALELVTSGRIALEPFVETFPLQDGAAVLEDVFAHRIARRAILTPRAPERT